MTKTKQESMMFIIGERIRHIRIQQGLSQKELGEKIEKSRVTINTLENGKRKRISPSLIHDIAQVLNQPVTYFYEGLCSERDTVALLKKLDDNSPLVPVFSRLSLLSPDKQAQLAEMINIVLDITFSGSD